MEVKEPSAKYLARPGYKQTEVGVIPGDWESTTVRDIASPIRNAIVGGPFGSDLVSNDYVEDGVPVVRGQNMGFRFVSGSFAFVTRAKASSLEANLARPRDLVFTQRGTLGQVSIVPDEPYDRYLISQSQMKLTVNRKAVDPLFFYYVFSSKEQQELIRQNTIQTGVPHINLGILRNIPVQRPSLAEQEAIAEVLSNADALIESLEQLLAKKRNIKQGAMQELLTGKKRLPGFNEDWEVKALSEICWFQEGPGVRNTQFTTSGVKLLNGTNIYRGALNLDSTSRFISEREASGPYAHFLADAGDIVIASSGITIERFHEKVAFVREYNLPFCMNTSTIRFRPFAKLLASEFLFHFLTCDSFKRAIGGQATGSAQLNFGPSHVAKVPVSLPPYSEQTAIAAVLSDMDTEIAALESKLVKARCLKQGMMQELLTGRIRLVEPTHATTGTSC